MKKVAAFILTMVMTFALVSCTKDKKPEKTKTTHIHSYTDYVCSGCGEVDSSHAYEYLAVWIKENGLPHDGNYACALVEIDNSTINKGISYDSSANAVFIFSADKTNDLTYYHMIYLDNYSFRFSAGADSIYGIVGASKYTRDTGELHIIDSECVDLEPDEYVPLAKSATTALLDDLRDFLSKKDLGITLADLGFMAY